MLKHNQKYLIIDTETDGLRLTNVKPWQIAWSLADGSRITKVYNEYLDFPDLEISDTIAKLTGFNWQEYNRRKKPPEVVWELLKKDLFDSNRIVVGQNLLGFDIFVIASLQKYLGQIPDYSYINRIIWNLS